METLTIVKSKVEIDETVRQLVQHQTERLTIVHCRVFSDSPTMLRIWPSTFLIEEDGTRRKLITHFNICLAPEWMARLVWNDFIHFTLVFEGLSKGCQQFHVFEDIPEPAGFYSEMLNRNKTDVYEVELMS